jgi:hypothetical protein
MHKPCSPDLRTARKMHCWHVFNHLWQESHVATCQTIATARPILKSVEHVTLPACALLARALTMRFAV